MGNRTRGKIHNTTLLSQHSNNIILGDFNLHVSDENDLDAATFTDTCEAFGLHQYVMFLTHNSGYILDLVLTELCGDVNVLRTHRGPFISNHVAVITQLNIKRDDPSRQRKMVWKVKDIKNEQWIQAYQDKDLTLSDDLDEMVTKLDDALKSILDELAPEKSVTVPLKPKQP